MERIFFKGLVFIIGIWAIWNSSKGVSDIGKTSLKDRTPKTKIEAPIANKPQPEEAKEQKTSGTFYMRKLED